MAKIEKSNDEKKAQLGTTQELPHKQPSVNTTNQSQTQSQNPNQSFPPGHVFKGSSSQSNNQKSRKNREHRTKSHDWPDVPDIGKIDESNPEILAKKILATGRQIEAGKFGSNQVKTQKKQDTLVMPAPVASKNTNKTQGNSGGGGVSNIPKHGGLNIGGPSPGQQMQQMAAGGGGKKGGHESHKVVDFEYRLKSIITSALQGQEQKAQQNSQVIPQHLVPHPHQQSAQQQQQSQQMSSISPKKSLPGYTTQNWTTISPGNLSIVTTPHQLPSATTISPTQMSPIKGGGRHMMQQEQHMDPNYAAMQKREREQQQQHYHNLQKSGILPMHPNDLNKMMMNQNPSQVQQQQMQQQQQIQQQQQYMRENPMIYQRNVTEDKREFKTPDNIRYERQMDNMGRSSVGSIENEYISSSNSNSAKSTSGQTQRSNSSLSQPGEFTLISFFFFEKLIL